MPKMSLSGFDGLSAQMQKLGKSAESIVSPALYEAAGIVYDAMRSEIEALPTDEKWRYPSDSYPMPTGIKEKQKQGLIDGLGISKFDSKGGEISVRIGFDGYNDLKTKNFPSGEPNVLIARELEKGTSRVPKVAFAKRAKQKAEQSAKLKMEQVIKERIDAL